MNYLVTILVPVFNIEKFVGKCIESLINQDYTNIEIILVDDCSTDSSGTICDDYALKDKRIKVIHNKINKGISCVRNILLDNANGEYLVWVDGDDWIDSDFVSYMLNVLDTTKTDFAINLSHYTTRDLKKITEKDPMIWSSEKATTELLFSHLTIGVWNKIFKRSIINENNIHFKEDLFTAEGYRFVSDVVQRVNSVGVANKRMYYYRLNNTGSATTKYDIRQSMGAIKAAIEIKKDLIIKTPYVVGAINTHIWLNHFWNIRQISALKLENEYSAVYKESIKFVKKYAFESAKNEPSLIKKIKYVLVGFFPVFIAKLKNYYSDFKLRLDIKKYDRKD